MNAPDLSHEIRQESMQKRIDQLCAAMQGIADEINEFGHVVSSERYDWFLRVLSARGRASVPEGYYSEKTF